MHTTVKLADEAAIQLDALETQLGQLRRTLKIVESDKRSSSGRHAIDPLPHPELVREIVRNRKHRKTVFGEGLFSDPAWDMILDLTVAHLEARRISVSSLCIASGVPPTTALRYISLLVDEGIFVRESDACDKRRAFISLSQSGLRSVARYFGETTMRRPFS